METVFPQWENIFVQTKLVFLSCHLSSHTHTHTFDPDWTQLNLVGNRIYFEA